MAKVMYLLIEKGTQYGTFLPTNVTLSQIKSFCIQNFYILEKCPMRSVNIIQNRQSFMTQCLFDTHAIWNWPHKAAIITAGINEQNTRRMGIQ